MLRSEVDLSTLTTLALPGRARWFAKIDALPSLLALLADLPAAVRAAPRLILGGGSNLVLNGDFPGLVLKMAISGRRLLGEDTEAWYVEADGGENWHDFVQWTLAQGWPGLENLSLIPGTVGAAPIQNIGAYGLEVGEFLHEVQAIDMNSGEQAVFDHLSCRFGYRDSVFKQEGWQQSGRYAITAVSFRLPKRWQARTNYADVQQELAAHAIATPDARQIADAVIAVRQRKLPDPAQLANAGSFFKNPVVAAALAARLAQQYPALAQYPQADGTVKLAAAWLIEQAGWKGRQLGPVGMYAKQALVLVNHGGATGAEVRALAQAVQADVQQRFGVHLEAEPVFV